MTEYGRGPGSEPWHPEDPLYGDQGWGGQQAAAGDTPYGGQPQQQYPQQYGTQHDPYQQQYNEQQQHYNQQQLQYNQQQQQYNQQQYNGGWDTGQQAAMPYGANPADTYGGREPGYGGESGDYYATPEAFPPPRPPGRRQPEPDPGPESTTDWDAEAPQEETHPFFTGDDGRDDDGQDDDDPRETRRGGGRERRGKTKKKSKNGCACLVVALVLAGGLGGVGYFGYQFWQGQFGAAAEDFTGAGSGSAEVEIPKGAGLGEIGAILKEAGVVKSTDAFVSAANNNPEGKSIQAGVYSLAKGQSAANAVEAMLNPASRSALVLFPGMRNAQVYEAMDKRLELAPGTTKGVAKQQAKSLGLPDWAYDNSKVRDPLEGFLYPSNYPMAKGTKPEDVLKKMVARANAEYAKFDFKAEASKRGLKSPLELITVASLVQAEGMTHDDFKKMAAVVYNRLKPSNTVTNQKLEFDSTYNYLKNQSKIDISTTEIRNFDDPYNTYFYKGLPPGAIGNPGGDALNAAMSPDDGAWMFFISIDGKTTKFTKTLSEHEKLVNEFNQQRRKGG
ncbi:endolytic transglycosylase MltG [Streptomyces sp. NPDC000880]